MPDWKLRQQIRRHCDRSWKPEAQARGWATAPYVDKRALNRRHAEESGTSVLVPNPSLALQVSMAGGVPAPEPNLASSEAGDPTPHNFQGDRYSCFTSRAASRSPTTFSPSGSHSTLRPTRKAMLPR